MDATMPDRGLPLSLWGIWWNAILLLRPAFSRLRTFMWFVTAVAGLTVRVELLGVTSIVRALNLRTGLYTKLLDHFHSSGVKLDRLSALWAQAVLQLFPGLTSLDRPCARRLGDLAVGTEECSRRGSNQRMDPTFRRTNVRRTGRVANGRRGAIQSDALTLRIFVIRLVGSDLRARRFCRTWPN